MKEEELSASWSSSWGGGRHVAQNLPLSPTDCVFCASGHSEPQFSYLRMGTVMVPALCVTTKGLETTQAIHGMLPVLTDARAGM